MEAPAWWREFATVKFTVTLFLMIGALYCTHIVLTTNTFSQDLRVAVVTVWVVTGIAEIRKFWLNSSSESERKNETINALATKKEGV